MSSALRPRGLYHPWNSPGQYTGVGSLSLLQRLFPSQGSNPGLPHCRQILYQLSSQGSPECSVTSLQRRSIKGRQPRSSQGAALGCDALGALKPLRAFVLPFRLRMTVVSASQRSSRLKWASSCHASFHDLCPSGFLGWLYFGPVHCGVLSSTLGFYSLDPTSNSLPSVLTTQDRSRHCHVSPWGPDGSHWRQQSAAVTPTATQHPVCVYCSLVWWFAVVPVLLEAKSLPHIWEEMAAHSSTLAWKIPWMEEPGGLRSVGSLRVGHD